MGRPAWPEGPPMFAPYNYLCHSEAVIATGETGSGYLLPLWSARFGGNGPDHTVSAAVQLTR